MKIRQLASKTAGAILGLSLLFAIGMSSSTTGHAQYRNGNNDQNDRNWDRYGDYGGSSDLRRTALNAGYNEGIKEGRKDNGGRTDYANQVTYRRATKGYNSRLGDRELYQRYFREGFEKGYNVESYATGNNDRYGRNRDRGRRNDDDGDRNRLSRNEDGYGNLGGSFQLRQTALNAGFNEGLKQGRNDRSKNNESGYQNQSTYQKATKDYSSRLGDREIYQRYFRKAYENGYADGIGGY